MVFLSHFLWSLLRMCVDKELVNGFENLKKYISRDLVSLLYLIFLGHNNAKINYFQSVIKGSFITKRLLYDL